MKYNLKKVRMSYGMSTNQFSKVCGLSSTSYELYEIKKEIPCKYIYRLSQRLPNFPVPNDFLYYTSFSLDINMKYHHMTQKEAAEIFGVKQQTISRYVQGKPFLMYEWKDKFLAAFKPFIVATECLSTTGGSKTILAPIQIDDRGNLMSTERRITEKAEFAAARRNQRRGSSIQMMDLVEA